MARVVATAPEPRMSTYNWPQYADGRYWELTQGEDFVAFTSEVARAARRWATRNGYAAEVSRRQRTVTVRFTPAS